MVSREEAAAKKQMSAAKALMELMRQLVLVREFESTCASLWKAGEHMVGEYHLSLGQEAIAVGACAAMDDGDVICPSIRGMGVYLCRGTPLTSLTCAFFDREGALAGGRWAHWHCPVPEVGILAQTGMLGSGLVTSVGVALANKQNKNNGVVIAMLGDGATNTGYFHEGMNFAAFRDLPVVVVVENNGYAVSTRLSDVVKVDNLSQRAPGYGILGETIDGNDVVKVRDTVRAAVDRARAGKGPSLIECKTYRFGGSTVKDADQLRPVDEKAMAQKNCPVDRFKIHLTSRGLLDDTAYERMVSDVRAEIEEAISYAKSKPFLDPGLAPAARYHAYVEGDLS